MSRIVVVEAPHHEISVMAHRALAGIVEHIHQGAGLKDYRVKKKEQQSTCAEDEKCVAPAARRVLLFVSIEGVEKKVQAQVMWEVFGSQHEAKARAARAVIPFRLSSAGRSGFFCPEIKVVSKPGEENEERVLLGHAVIHNGDGSDRPKQGAEQANLGAEKFLSQKENDDSRERAEYDVGQTDRNFLRYRMGPSNSLVPRVRGRQRGRDHRLHQH